MAVRYFSATLNAIVKLKTTFINKVVCDPEICSLTSSILVTIIIQLAKVQSMQ